MSRLGGLKRSLFPDAKRIIYKLTTTLLHLKCLMLHTKSAFSYLIIAFLHPIGGAWGSFGVLGDPLGRPWGILGGQKSALGSPWGSLGGPGGSHGGPWEVLGGSWGILGRYLVSLVGPWGSLGGSLGALGGSLGGRWGVLGGHGVPRESRGTSGVSFGALFRVLGRYKIIEKPSFFIDFS